MIYGIRSNGNQHGLVLTKPIVVNTMLDRVGYQSHLNLGHLSVVEPAAGDGAFGLEIIERLHQSSLKFGFSFQNALLNLQFFELNIEMACILRNKIATLLQKFSATLPIDMIREEDFLTAKTARFDLVIGNPPYVRHENIPDEQKNQYRRMFKTFKHRSDLYIAFYEKGLRILNNDGILSYICSNRWLKNQYGQELRNLIEKRYTLKEIIDLEETSPFEEEVIAYPAITTIHNLRKPTQAAYLKLSNLEELTDLNDLKEKTRVLHTGNYENWFSYVPEGLPNERFLESIEQQGFKIGIGVATGLDKVFIRQDFKALVEEDLLLPILISKDLRNNAINWSGNYLLNPFDELGKLIDLSLYPKARRYFEAHKQSLAKRHVARKNPNFWYKTIDKVYAHLTSEHKIVLPDISGNTHLLIDKGRFYPHHNLYYITCKDDSKLEILAALLMSDLVRNQLMELGIKMNGGYPRWQSQNLKRLRVPIIDAIPIEVIAELRMAYRLKDYNLINTLITGDSICEFNLEVGQLKLFEP